MSSWAVTAVRNALPDGEMFWAVQERCSDVIDTDHLVDHLQVFPREKWKKNRWSPATWADQLRRYTSLRKYDIDIGFDFQGHSKTALCLRLSGCRERFSARATDAFAARISPPVPLVPEGPHEVQLALALVKARLDVTCPNRTRVPELSQERVKATALADGQLDRLVTIQTGAGEADKVYPPELWKVVAESLAVAGWNVVTIGGPGDPVLATDAVRQFVGTLSLKEALALVSLSRLHLSSDTGTGHAAAAFGVPTVTLFSRTDPDRFRPWGNEGIVLREKEAMPRIGPEDVISASIGLLKESQVARPG